MLLPVTLDRMRQKQFDIPILFIIFCRKDTALQVINAIAKVKPKKLYVSQDGPRNEEEKKEVLETRKAVLSRINWKCDLTLWTHKKNLGLKKHIPQAFDRVFNKEEWCIYLEDDTLPSESFFYFQREVLKKYKYDQKIFSVNGSNLFPNLKRSSKIYYFTQIANVWGMGIWRRSWKLYESNIEDINDFKWTNYKDYIFDKKYFYYLLFFINMIRRKKLSTWDFQLAYTAIKNRMYFVSPYLNLVSNIGVNNRSGSNISFDRYETGYGYLDKRSIAMIILNNKPPIYSKEYDKKYFNYFYNFFYVRMFLNFIFYMLPKDFRNFMFKLFLKVLR